jgi:dephospho-CoA kinase
MKLKPEYIKQSTQERLYHIDLPIMSLTGGIASGKSTVACLLNRRGLPIISADELVKDIYKQPSTLAFIQKELPEVITNGSIQFPLLRERFFLNKHIKQKVENYIYPKMPEAFKTALDKLQSPDVIIYDVPLLFERGMKGFFDLNVLVYAPRDVQLKRLQSRDGSNEDLANNILNQQMDIELKKSQSDIIIDNSKGKEDLEKEVDLFIRQVFTE